MGPRNVRSSVLTAEQEALIVAFRKHTLLPLDDCLYTLQATIPHLTRSSKFQVAAAVSRHGLSICRYFAACHRDTMCLS